MTNKRTLYLHVGMPKTGTTTIQNFLRINRELLKQQDVYYPITVYEIMGKESYKATRGLNLVSAPATDDSTSLLAYQNVFNARWYETGENRQLDLILEDIAKNENGRVIFSGEAMWVMPDFYYMYKGIAERPKDRVTEQREYLEKIKKNFEGFDIKLIAYLRRQDLFLESMYAQFFKESIVLNSDIADIERQLPMDYFANLEVMAEVFGKQNIAVRPFEREQWSGNDLLADFCSVIGVNAENFQPIKTDAIILNSALAPKYVAFKSAAYANPPTRAQGWHDYTNTLRNLSYYAESESGSKVEKVVFLSPKQRRKILDRYEESNARVAAEYIAADRSKLFLEAPTFPERTKLNLTLEDVAQISSALFVEAQTRARLAERRTQQLAKRLREIEPGAAQTIVNLARTQQDLARTQQDLTQTRQDLTQTQQDLTEARQDLVRARRNLAQARVLIETHTAALAEHVERLALGERTAGELRADLAASQAEAERHAAELEGHRDLLRQAEQTASDLRAQIERQDAALRALHQSQAVAEETIQRDIAAVNVFATKLQGTLKQQVQFSHTINDGLVQLTVATWLRTRRRWRSRLKRLFTSEVKAIRTSRLFDADYYLSKNPDVKEGRLNPIQHYVRFGAAELRDPSATFSTAEYFMSQPDIVYTGRNPLIDSVLKKAPVK